MWWWPGRMGARGMWKESSYGDSIGEISGGPKRKHGNGWWSEMGGLVFWWPGRASVGAVGATEGVSGASGGGTCSSGTSHSQYMFPLGEIWEQCMHDILVFQRL